MKPSTIGLYVLAGVFVFLPTAIMLLIVKGTNLIMRGLVIAVATVVMTIEYRRGGEKTQKNYRLVPTKIR